VVLTGHALGGIWLGEAVWGVPVGLWFVTFCGLTAWLHGRWSSRPAEPAFWIEDAAPASAADETPELRTPAPPATAEPTAAGPGPARDTETTPAFSRSSDAETAPRPALRTLRATWPASWAPAAGLAGLSGLARLFEAPTGGETTLARSIADWMDARPTPTRALRVGVQLTDRAAALLAEGSPRDLEWVRLDGGSTVEAARRLNLDAVVVGGGHESPETLVVRSREHTAHEAAWFDWGSDRPITYFSVFPMRLDASRVTLPGVLGALEKGDHAAAAWARRLVRVAALGSRYPARLTLADRLSGRTAVPRGGAGLDITAETLREAAWSLTGDSPLTDRTVARVTSAWIATAPDTLGDRERCELADRVVGAAGDEAEVLLRVAAVRLAMLDERLGVDALVRADRLVRQRGTIEGLDHMRLLQAELEHGTFGAMTLGRVAAGICLACAVTPADRISFLRDDLLDDLHFSSYLVGRDREHAILIDVFRQLERNRRADAYGLPAAA
jgi:hypothetical protein